LKTRAEEIAAWAAGLALDDVPEHTLERARLQAASTVAAALAGSTAPGVLRLREAVRTWAADGPAGVIGEDDPLEPAAAAYANAAASIAHDWDDYLYMGHTGHSSVWAARAMADALGASAADTLAAQVAANEVAARLGAAVFVGPHNGQFWSSIHAAGAAVAAGRLRGLDAVRLAHAIGIALYQPPYGLWPGFMGPDTKLLTAAEPVAQGLRAAALAQQGFTGPLDVIENRRGFLRHFSFAPREELLGGLGSVWLTDTLAYKPHPGCAYLQAAVDGVLQHEVEAGDVAHVEVRAGWLTTAMEQLSDGAGLTPVRVNFSVALSTAVALVAGRLTHRELHEDWLDEHADEVRSLAARVSLEHDWDMTAQTLAGTGTELPLRRLPALRRRMRDIGMDEVAFGLSDLRELARRVPLREALRPGPPSLPDPASLRLTFPAHVTIRLRSGGTLEAAGRERGGCGAPLEEQREVVDAKWDATREAAALPAAWRS